MKITITIPEDEIAEVAIADGEEGHQLFTATVMPGLTDPTVTVSPEGEELLSASGHYARGAVIGQLRSLVQRAAEIAGKVADAQEDYAADQDGD